MDAALQAGTDRHQARLRPCGMWILHRPYRRHSTLFVFGAHAHGAWPEGIDDRRSGSRRRNLASGAAGCHRRAGISVRVLHAWFHNDRGRILENESQSHAPGTGARCLGKSLPLPGLRQDSYGVDARGGEYAEVVAWLTVINSRITRTLWIPPSLPSAPTASGTS